MADQEKPGSIEDRADVGLRPARPARRRAPRKQPPKLLPPWKVMLHNDDVNVFDDVVKVVRKLTGMKQEEAHIRVKEAHTSGCALLLVTHQDRAELYVEQFASCRVTVTIEPDA